MIFLGAAGFFACLGVLFIKARTLDGVEQESISLNQEALLMSEDLARVGLDVVVRDAQLAIDLPENVLFFDVNDSSLKPEAQGKIRAIAASITERYREYQVRSVGHADSAGDANYNLELGQRRAKVVANSLIISGLIENRVAAMSMGEDAPIAPNDSREGRAMNRRVEVQVSPQALVHQPPKEDEDKIPGAISGKDSGEGKPSPFVEVLQENPLFVTLGCLSSLIGVISGMSEAVKWGRKRKRGA